MQETPDRCRVLCIRRRLRGNAVRYGEGRPEEGLRPPTWPLISLMTSSARLVLSSPAPNKERRNRHEQRQAAHYDEFHAHRARLQIPRGLTCKIERSFTVLLPVQSTLHCKVLGKKIRPSTASDRAPDCPPVPLSFPSPHREPPAPAWRDIRVSLAAGCRDATDGLRAIVIMSF